MKRRSASRLIPILSALGVLYLVFTGCGTRQASPLTDEMAARCVVVTDGRDSTGWSRWLDEHLGKSPRYPIDRIEEALSTSLKDDTILIIPGVTLESSHEEPLEDYIARGGRMLLLGANHPAIQLENPRIRQATGAGLGSYPVTSRVLRLDSRNEKIEIAPVQISCLFPPAPGSANDANPASWVKVWEAANAHGVAAGWAGSVLLIPQTDAGFSICGWLAFDPPPASDKPLESIVARMITETDRSAYLTRFGTGAFSFLEQKPVVAHAQMIDRRTRDFSPLRLAARWLDRNGQEIRRHISEPLDSPALRTELSVGVAPDVFGREPELFTLEWQIRDRNDLETLDAQSQIIKVFPKKNDSVKAEPVSVSGHTLVAGRRPVFMLGVNYWPRLSSRTAGLAGSGHWLHPARFDPGVLSSDLDLMTAAGINCIAIEYTDLSQAPQILFVLDELRKRSMRSSIYMPSFHPFDLRREEGLAMLDAIDAGEWPEFFALEVARGIAVRSRADLRRLDTAWSEWLDQRFVSISEV